MCLFLYIYFVIVLEAGFTLYFFFSKSTVKKSFRNTISVSKVLDPDQGRSVRKLFVKVINR